VAAAVKFTKYEPGENPNPGPCVAIFCDDKCHPGKEAKVAFFFRSPGDTCWQVMPAWSVKVSLDGGSWSLQMLHGHHALDDAERKAIQPGDPMPRRRFELKCPLCGDRLPVKAENMTPVLDTLAEHADAWLIELTAIRARLVK